jgi:hypothetical protein
MTCKNHLATLTSQDATVEDCRGLCNDGPYIYSECHRTIYRNEGRRHVNMQAQHVTAVSHSFCVVECVLVAPTSSRCQLTNSAQLLLQSLLTDGVLVKKNQRREEWRVYDEFYLQTMDQIKSVTKWAIGALWGQPELGLPGSHGWSRGITASLGSTRCSFEQPSVAPTHARIHEKWTSAVGPIKSWHLSGLASLFRSYNRCTFEWMSIHVSHPANKFKLFR